MFKLVYKVHKWITFEEVHGLQIEPAQSGDSDSSEDHVIFNLSILCERGNPIEERRICKGNSFWIDGVDLNTILEKQREVKIY